MKTQQRRSARVAAKSAPGVGPAGAVAVPPCDGTLIYPKRKRGRPFGSKKVDFSVGKLSGLTPEGSSGDPADRAIPQIGKLAKVFQRALADQDLADALPDFDGGGTPVTSHTITKESLERRVARRLNVIDRYLTDDKLFALLKLSSLKEVGIYEGIMMDKSLLLKGQPTVIIGNEDRKTLDENMPRLLAEMKRRGLITSVSERKVEFRNALPSN
jgi:hypothetical protein